MFIDTDVSSCSCAKGYSSDSVFPITISFAVGSPAPTPQVLYVNGAAASILCRFGVDGVFSIRTLIGNSVASNRSCAREGIVGFFGYELTKKFITSARDMCKEGEGDSLRLSDTDNVFPAFV
ncbi:unnamed protein product [Rhodiola kirilowii]